jgi:crossover junction endodeoxyribonuclease RuvC
MKIGIDPGITGAIAFLYDDLSPIQVYDTPVMPMGKHQQINGSEVAKILAPKVDFEGTINTTCFIEQVAAMPGQGVVSMFNFCMSYGIVIGVCEALKIPVTFVRPNAWKKRAGLINKPKEAARTLAQLYYPGLDLSLKKHVGRADALLIARFGFLC